MRQLFGYVATAFVVGLVLLLLHPSTNAFGFYYCVSFWGLLMAELRWSKKPLSVDRFLSYIFLAPLVWPARLYELTRKDCGCKH